jgi:hypothetical protein
LSIQHWNGLQTVIKFVNDLRQGQLFYPGTPVSSTKKTYRRDIAEIMLKVALNTIKQPTKRSNNINDTSVTKTNEIE